MAPKTIKIAEVITAMEKGITDGVIIVDPSIPLQEIIKLHRSKKEEDEIKLFKLVEKGKIRFIFKPAELKGAPEKAKYIKVGNRLFIYLNWALT